jgi:putative ABC transport system permease protein
MKLALLYLYRNLSRNPMRTILTCAAVALPLVIYVLSTAVVYGLDLFLENSARQMRLAVTHKTSIVNPLPSGHRKRIESLDPTRERILYVCGMRWIGGKVEDNPRLLSTLAADVDTFPDTFPEYQLTQEEIDAWNRERRAIILGSATAEYFGWKVGDRITIRPSLPPYTPMEFRVVAVPVHGNDPITNWCRLDYLLEELERIGISDSSVSFIFVKCASMADLDHYRVAIDELFARTPDETKTQDEKSFMNEFITQQFDLPRNLTILAAVTVFVAVMAATNTMGLNFRDRISEYAILKSMGFRGWFVFGLIQTESLLLAGIGGLIGAAIPFVAFTHTPLKDFTVPLIQTLDIPLRVCLQAVFIGLCVGLLAAVWPAWRAARLRVISALRNLE